MEIEPHQIFLFSDTLVKFRYIVLSAPALASDCSLFLSYFLSRSFPSFPIGRWAIVMNFSRQRKKVWQIFCFRLYLNLFIVVLIAPIRALCAQLSKFSVTVLTNKMCCSPVESIPSAASALDSGVNRDSKEGAWQPGGYIISTSMQPLTREQSAEFRVHSLLKDHLPLNTQNMLLIPSKHLLHDPLSCLTCEQYLDNRAVRRVRREPQKGFHYFNHIILKLLNVVERN